MAQQSKKKNASNIGPAGKALIVLFAVLMALSLMLPSLSSIFSSSSSSSTSSEQTTSSDDPSSSDDSSSESSETDYVAKADEKYGAQVTALEEKYASDPVNLATLLNLGKNYMTWGTYVRYFGSTDADTSHANELLSNAVKYYDEYLAIKDSAAVRVDKALCAYYQEDGTSALQQLKELTESAPDYGPAWANLGLLYEASGDEESAKAAYAKAQETDPNDEYGAKSYATQRLASLESSDETDDSDESASEDAAAGDSSETTGSSTGVQGLTDTLSDLTGSSL